jgi:predicted dehydrogenase|tara:strand:+ start:300 stop:1262 length:963 start_codon:yes stop_codon:yes gene_type:complete
MNNILIIGAGQLGSRHLQGALLSRTELNITVVDPSQESLNVARERALEVKYGNPHSTVSYKTAMPNNKTINICIVATTANVRAIVTKQLLLTNEVKQIIFEKVLFQKLAEYKEVIQLLRDKNTVGWVNCPRRLYSTYVMLKQHLDRSKPIHMKVSGSAWGMACNSIHFLDIFSYLVGDSSIELMESRLDDEMKESKRPGFYETTGELKFTSGIHSIVVQSVVTGTVEHIVSFENEQLKCILNELRGTCTLTIGDDEKQFKHTALYQSKLTGIYIDDLLSSNKCQLTPFEQSCEQHIPFITALLSHMSEVLNKRIDVCPIT